MKSPLSALLLVVGVGALAACGGESDGEVGEDHGALRNERVVEAEKALGRAVALVRSKTKAGHAISREGFGRSAKTIAAPSRFEALVAALEQADGATPSTADVRCPPDLQVRYFAADAQQGAEPFATVSVCGSGGQTVGFLTYADERYELDSAGKVKAALSKIISGKARLGDVLYSVEIVTDGFFESNIASRVMSRFDLEEELKDTVRCTVGGGYKVSRIDRSELSLSLCPMPEDTPTDFAGVEEGGKFIGWAKMKKAAAP